MKDNYQFTAIFNYADDGISISFPDLPGCISCAETTEEGLNNAEEALGLMLVHLEREGEKIPEATPIEKIKYNEKERMFLISVWMPLARSEVQDVNVKKTLTIPKWLNDLAEEKHVNFSKVLKAALKDYLKIKKMP